MVSKYPYTLQTIAINMNELEFKQAQISLFEQNAKGSYGISSVKLKEWTILAIIVLLAVIGLVFVKGYSTILFWVMLVGVLLYLIVRTLGMKWYVKREFDKQIASIQIPEDMKEIKLGVQKHGLVMSVPNTANTASRSRGKGKRGMQMQVQAASQRQAVIPWDSVTSWEENDSFMFVMFEMQGQQGSQIIPKRLAQNKFPIDTVRKHLSEVKEKGLKTDNVSM